MITSRIDIEKIRCPFNLVLIEADPYHDNLKIGEDLELQMVDAYDPGFYISVTGRVIAPPDRIVFNQHKKDELVRRLPGKRLPGHWLKAAQYLTERSANFGTEIEIQKDDKVFFNFTEHLCSEEEGREFYQDGKKYMFVRYDRLYLAVRNETEYIPLNGCLLVEPTTITQDQLQTFSVINVLKETELPGHGIIRYIGKPNSGYLGFKNVHDIDELKVGMEISFNRSMRVPLEYEVFETFAERKRLFTLWRKDVLAIHGQV